MAGSQAIRVIVHGRVQGVGFRQFTAAAAHRLGLAGWVRNLPSGDVEAVAQGSAAARAQFLAALQRGPSLARVESLETFPAEPLPDSGARFRIQH